MFPLLLINLAKEDDAIYYKVVPIINWFLHGQDITTQPCWTLCQINWVERLVLQQQQPILLILGKFWNYGVSIFLLQFYIEKLNITVILEKNQSRLQLPYHYAKIIMYVANQHSERFSQDENHDFVAWLHWTLLWDP